MAASSSVLYPAGVSFKMDYYLKTHMPLVQEKWTKYGLTSWQVVEFDDDAPYKVQAILEWTSTQAMKDATSSVDAKAVFGDIPNFSDKQPVFLGGQTLKATSCV